MPWRPVASALLVMVVAAPGCERRGAAVRVFVSNEDSGDVTVIDAERDEVVATIAVGKRPRGIRAAPDGRLVYVAVSGSPKGGPSAKPPGEGDARDESADGIVVVDVAERRVVRVRLELEQRP